LPSLYQKQSAVAKNGWKGFLLNHSNIISRSRHNITQLADALDLSLKIRKHPGITANFPQISGEKTALFDKSGAIRMNSEGNVADLVSMKIESEHGESWLAWTRGNSCEAGRSEQENTKYLENENMENIWKSNKIRPITKQIPIAKLWLMRYLQSLWLLKSIMN